MKRSKKNKITETIVNQLQEEKKEEAVVKTKPHRHHRPHPQVSKLFNTPVQITSDSETDGINFGMSGIL